MQTIYAIAHNICKLEIMMRHAEQSLRISGTIGGVGSLFIVFLEDSMFVYKRIIQLFLPVAAIMLIAVLPASAQEEALSVTEEETIEYNDEQLERVANAYVSITEIRQDLQDGLTEVADEEQARALQQQAGADMVEAVEETGLAVDEYNEIVEKSQVNGNLRNRLMLMINMQQ